MNAVFKAVNIFFKAFQGFASNSLFGNVPLYHFAENAVLAENFSCGSDSYFFCGIGSSLSFGVEE